MQIHSVYHCISGWASYLVIKLDIMYYNLRHCATSQNVTGSRPDEVNEFFKFT
jgi:hypothetical protein